MSLADDEDDHRHRGDQAEDNPGQLNAPAPPKSASIRSSPEAMKLPIASGAEKTTPIVVSVALCASVLNRPDQQRPEETASPPPRRPDGT